MTTASTASPPLRIAFKEIRSDQWPGGAHYCKNLFHALRSLENGSRPELTLLRDSSTGSQAYGNTEAGVDRILAEPETPRPGFLQKQVKRVRRKLRLEREPEPIVGPFLRENGVDIFFGDSLQFGPLFRVPLLSWIPDFQFLRMPELFAPADVAHRKQNFEKVARYATRVVLSSEDALRDFAEFAPAYASKGRVLHFVSQLPADVYAHDAASVCQRYHLPERFVYLPNQFWKSKNHEVVVRALGLLKATRPDIVVVCSGNVYEPRTPLHTGKLMALISELNVRDTFVILGFLPHDDIFRLLRQSLAVLQPSIFEGWATSVEESHSLGKPMIISDLPVHREQNPPGSHFFDPHSPEGLAKCLVQIFDSRRAGPDETMEAEARRQLPERTRAFAETFVTIAREAIANP